MAIGGSLQKIIARLTEHREPVYGAVDHVAVLAYQMDGYNDLDCL